MSMFGEIKFFFGLQIQQKKDGIYITQSKYIKEILKKFGMEDCKPVGTPMCTGLKFTKEDESKEVDRSRVGILVTLSTVFFGNFTGPVSNQKAPSWILLNTMHIHSVLKTIGKTRVLVRPFFSTIENSSLGFHFHTFYQMH
ncbi:reverse transcriptase domain-containing protein [Enterobacter hormaechei]|uniref:reverse transcriptase domain-containing protein n=1 Tax=Enterobacter hormaechei TaxID=158836 RepID=UPI0023E35E7D|nr:reverse transcriptase domain-containing protein [Enterobacter hormaechei]MDF3675375.1 reverse transcriptase domain-containing protein [Enterobacter hormaechei]